MIDYLPAVATLTPAALLFSWLTVNCVELFIPLSRRSRMVGTFGVLVVIAALSASHAGKFKMTPPPPRKPVPCAIGTDFDIRDGLCYKRGLVPRQFQRD